MRGFPGCGDGDGGLGVLQVPKIIDFMMNNGA